MYKMYLSSHLLKKINIRLYLEQEVLILGINIEILSIDIFLPHTN